LLVQILLSFVLSFVRHSPVFCMSFVYLSITKLFDKINNSIYTTHNYSLGRETATFSRKIIKARRFSFKRPNLLGSQRSQRERGLLYTRFNTRYRSLY